MLATFVIGLREGLEAALIVGIIAAFLRNNSKSLRPMWLGVALAVILSISVGVALKLVEQALPQAEQEGLETIIGAIAICFVTGMVVWMHNHARHLKRQLESEAAQALGRASAWALASMAFLAVLKEGFETSVFLLATFSAAQSAVFAASGAVIGIAVAVVIGWGIYAGGVRFNLSRFFRTTAAFLVLVAAGLVISSLRTAHEAGWINAGQHVLLNLGWLVAPGTIQSALITGVLGIPADPRVIEVLGWLAYLVPVSLYLYWPQERRLGQRGAARLKIALGAGALFAAIALAIGYPDPRPVSPAQALMVNTKGAQVGTARLANASDQVPAKLVLAPSGSPQQSLVLADNQGIAGSRDGMQATVWKLARSTTPAQAPTKLTLQDVVSLAGGRIPIGLNPRHERGPFNADWSLHRMARVWLAHGLLLDAAGRSMATVTLSGGGLGTSLTLTVRAATSAFAASEWRLSPAYVQGVVSAIHTAQAATVERQFWALQLPVVLALAALILVILGGRTLARLRRPIGGGHPRSTAFENHPVEIPESRGVSDVA